MGQATLQGDNHRLGAVGHIGGLALNGNLNWGSVAEQRETADPYGTVPPTPRRLRLP
jgi:hypothetical protein